MNKKNRNLILLVIIGILLLAVTAIIYVLDKDNKIWQLRDLGINIFATKNPNCITDLDTTSLVEVRDVSNGFQIDERRGYTSIISPGDDNARSVTATRDGGFIISGWTRGFGAGDFDFLVLKYSPAGSLIWSKLIGKGSNDCAFRAKELTDGGIAVTGCSMSFTRGDFDAVIQKLDSQGNLIWSKAAGRKFHDHYYDFTETKDGSLLAVGDSWNPSGNSYNVLISKYTQSGKLIYSKAIDPSFEARILSIKNGDNGLVGVGCVIVPGSTFYNSFFLFFDQKGEFQGSKINNLPQDNCLFAIEKTTDGNYIAAGHIFNKDKRNYDVLLEKIDQEGNAIWTTESGGEDEQYALAVGESSTGEYFIAGGSSNTNHTKSNVYLSFFNQKGDNVRAGILPTDTISAADSAAEIGDDLFLVGYNQNPSMTNYDALVVKIRQTNSLTEAGFMPFQANTFNLDNKTQDWAIHLQNLCKRKLVNPEFINNEVDMVKNYINSFAGTNFSGHNFFRNRILERIRGGRNTSSGNLYLFL